jgi:uncharacterized protein YdeI (YjbR/CyaY-like superfamily)
MAKIRPFFTAPRETRQTGGSLWLPDVTDDTFSSLNQGDKMGTRDPKVDAYIAKSADFAKPVLKELRDRVHEACPDVQETTKWSSPFFEYHGVLCNMAAFKEHCAFGFWKGQLVVEGNGKNAEAAGQFGRIRSVSDLPSKKVMAGFIKRAMKLNEEGVKSPNRSKPRNSKPEAEVPEYLQAALKKNSKAKAAFDAFSASHRREYIEWITEAKTDATRDKRIATTIEWLVEGKSRNWKYQR